MAGGGGGGKREGEAMEGVGVREGLWKGWE